MERATKIVLTDFKSIPMRTFHCTWVAFFSCFFAWFATAPLMPIIRQELHLTKPQIGSIVVASISMTVLARVMLGHFCDKWGPRRTYAWLLFIGALPVAGIGFSQNFAQFLFWKLLIGAIGASFVLTQYHTSVMFDPKVVGTANATAAGWGNLGGGAAQIIMPFLYTAALALGVSGSMSWRLSFLVPAAMMVLCGFAYLLWTRDTPSGKAPSVPRESSRAAIGPVLRDSRVWLLFMLYGACFGIEITMDNVGVLYFTDKFGLSLRSAGLVAGAFGAMNLFARALGGILSDRFAARGSQRSRARFLAAAVLMEGACMMAFSRMSQFPLAVAFLLLFGLFVKMAEGATYSVVPFISSPRLGFVSGIVGAGGNIGAMLAGTLFGIAWLRAETAFLILGAVIAASSILALLIRLPEAVPEVKPEVAKIPLQAAACPVPAEPLPPLLEEGPQ